MTSHPTHKPDQLNNSRSLTDNLHKRILLFTRHVIVEHDTNSRCVELELHRTRFHPAAFCSLETIIKAANRNFDALIETEYASKIFGFVQQQFLPISVPHFRMRFHDDSGLCPINTGRPRSRKARYPAVA